MRIRMHIPIHFKLLRILSEDMTESENVRNNGIGINGEKRVKTRKKKLNILSTIKFILENGINYLKNL